MAGVSIPMPNQTNSRAAAIDAHCRNCIYDSLSAGTWREQVAACSSGGCDLFAVRPVPASVRNDKVKLAALRARLDKANRPPSAVTKAPS